MATTLCQWCGKRVASNAYYTHRMEHQSNRKDQSIPLVTLAIRRARAKTAMEMFNG